MSRKKARIGAMQLLYAMEACNDYSNKTLELFIDNHEFLGDELDYINRVIPDLVENLETIDNTIEKNLKGWTVSRLAKVDRQILRIAVYEFLYKDDIPPEVSINEAVDIARQYSTEDSPKFVNGILGSIYRSL
ncbi:transcription antitermination factor NusB [Peptoniphilus sp.]|jgi:N utilization substance protein B|uniref:transcription antitermination factor NusB n=1 Tax=Peptoniphilus sp. TaxID=1971214 RepID=UPI003D91D36F